MLNIITLFLYYYLFRNWCSIYIILLFINEFINEIKNVYLAIKLFFHLYFSYLSLRTMKITY